MCVCVCSEQYHVAVGDLAAFTVLPYFIQARQREGGSEGETVERDKSERERDGEREGEGEWIERWREWRESGEREMR